MDKRYFTDKLVKWYEGSHRDLPWRHSRDPYTIWLSEIILQQTRVAQGIPYYNRFIQAYPTVKSLAAASEQEVLRLWQGLGYYSRARNMHKCAQKVYYKLEGKFPSDYEGLRQLPGIGDYTAAAIASLAFKQCVAVVDGNVFRVLSRVFGIDTIINSPTGKKVFADLANSLISRVQPDTHNQAVMEFGALVCTPKKPGCANCILQSGCVAFSKNLQDKLPIKKRAKTKRTRYFYYLVFRKGNSLLMKKREERDIWHGLFDFVLIEKTRSTKIERVLEDFEASFIEQEHVSAYYKHVLSHQTILSKFIVLKSAPNFKASQKLKYYSRLRVAELPKPVLITRFLADQHLL